MIDDTQPVCCIHVAPNDLPPGIPHQLRGRIYADLLRIQSAKLESGKSVGECIRVAYDSFAEAFQDQTRLTLDYIERKIRRGFLIGPFEAKFGPTLQFATGWDRRISWTRDLASSQ